MGFRSGVSTTGFGGYYCNRTNYAPIAGTRKGGSIRMAMKRYASGALYAPIMGFMVGQDPTTAQGYMLGLSEASSYQIALRKGVPSAGLDPSASSILRLSTASYTAVGDSAAAWFHLRLDVLVNPHGETVLNVYRNDLNSYAVTSPTWAAIAGMDSYVDDSIGILTGSTPYLDGFYAFFGMYSEASGSMALFDHCELYRQTSP